MNKGNFIEAEIIIEIPFYDVDSLNVVWHGNYAKYLEKARCVLLDKLDYNYVQMKEEGYAWPVVHLNIKYIRPLIFKQKILIKAILVEYENCLKIKYLITDFEKKEKLTKAETLQVAINLKNGELCYTSPAIFLEKIKKFKNN